MGFYKNKAIEDSEVDVMYIEAESNPNEDYYFECTAEEIGYAIRLGFVVESYEGIYTKKGEL